MVRPPTPPAAALALALPLALLAGGCEDPGPKLTLVYMSPQGSERVLLEAARFQGGIPVHVDGAPAGWGDADGLSVQLAARFATAQARPDWRIEGAGRPPRGPDGTRIVVSFDPETGFSGVSICQGEEIGGEEIGGEGIGSETAPDPMSFRLVICDGARRAAEALATLPRPAGPETEPFRRLFSEAAAAVVEREQERRR
ncbi:MAG: hypothetical protein NXI21_11900 [Alphaproteobacteria bacterium]|nr:hypothetical protein [Alphaproteobacteria bacterium]